MKILYSLLKQVFLEITLMPFELKPVWEVNAPHQDVLAKSLEDVRFAANLAEVASGKAPSIYSDATEFFLKTFPTKSLKNLLENVAGRLNGEDAQCIYRLETFMGGGKTHALIALYHLGKHGSIASKEFTKIKVPPNTRVVSFVGTDPDTSTMTMWGEIAYKLGSQAYKVIKDSDEKRSTPGVNKLKEILGGQPTLILIDEIAHYLEKAAAVSYADTTLARQTVVFLRELLDAASQLPQCVVVLTLTSTQEAYGERTQQVLDALREMQQIAKRMATVEILTTEEEIHGVVRRRLFAEWDDMASKNVADALRELYSSVETIPDHYRTATYHDKIVNGYPFHPELIDILAKRVASIQRFNRTRGMLRFLARVVRNVWRKKSKDAYVVMPCDADLADSEIRAELTKSLEIHEFDAAVASDVATDSGNAKAQLIDQAYLEKGLPPIATQLSNAIYLNTLIVGQKAGVDFGRLLVDVLLPRRETGWYENALETMLDDFWYLHFSGGLYFFYKEPTLAKIIQDEVGKVNPNEVRGAIYKRIQNLYERGQLFRTVFWPEDTATVIDDQSLKLIVLDYRTDALEPLAKTPPKRALELWENTTRGPRTYKNVTFFVVPDKSRIDRMSKVAREYLAIRNIVESPETYSSLSEEQRKKLVSKQKQSELDFAISIADTYRFLFVPRNSGLSPMELQPKEIGDVEIDARQKIVFERLKTHHPPKIVSTLDPEYVLSAAWPRGKTEVSTSTLYDHFFEWSHLPLPENVNVVKQAILNGIERRLWVYYYGGQAFLAGQPKPAVMIAPDVVLYTLEEAHRLGFCTKTGEPIKKVEKPPPEEKPPPGDYLEEADLARKVVERIQSSIQEKKLTKFSSMQLEFSGGKADRALGAIFPIFRDAAAEQMRIQVTIKSLPTSTEKDAVIDLDARLKPVAYEKVKQYLFQLADVSGEEPQVKVTLNWAETPCDLPSLTKLLDYLKDYGINLKLSIYGSR